MKSKKKTKVWITKDHKRIPINELSDTHLFNIIRMLNRMAKKNQEAIAQYWNKEVPNWQELLPFIYKDLAREQARRIKLKNWFPDFNDMEQYLEQH